MGKFLGVVLSVIILISLFFGCSSQVLTDGEKTDKGVENIAKVLSSDQDDLIQGHDDMLEKENLLLFEVLNNKKTFVDETGENVYLKDYRIFSAGGTVEGKATAPEKYAVVDFDDDGTDELLVYVSPNYGAYLLFHMDNDNVYGFEFPSRSFTEVNKDGTFVSSASAGIQHYHRLSFKNDKCEMIEIAYSNSLPGQEEYRVNGKLVTGNEFYVFYEEFRKKVNVEWIGISN